MHNTDIYYYDDLQVGDFKIFAQFLTNRLNNVIIKTYNIFKIPLRTLCLIFSLNNLCNFITIRANSASL